MSTTEHAAPPAGSTPPASLAGTPTSSRSPVGAPAARPLSERHSRLARYLYAADLARGRRLLDIGGDGEGAQLLLERGAQAAIGLVLSGAVGVQRHPKLAQRPIERASLFSPDGLRRLFGEARFDIIFLPPDRALLLSPAFLGEVKRALTPGGLVVAGARSKEAYPADPGAVGYFELLDAMNGAGLGPVTMLGQAPFFASSLAPLGAGEPPLVLDDSLAPPDAPDDYVALAGPARGERPYAVVRLPRTALDLPARSEKPAEKIVERIEVKVPDPAVVADRDRIAAERDRFAIERDRAAAEREKLAAEKDRLGTERERIAIERDRVVAEREKLVAERDKLGTERDKASVEAGGLRREREELKTKLLDLQALCERREQQVQTGEAAAVALQKQKQDLDQALQKSKAQRAEIEEQLRQYERSDSERGQGALLHERQMRELRTALEEREAFVAELEEQAHELPRLQERLTAAEQRAEQAAAAERHTRQRLAEVEGLLLRVRGELQQRAQDAALVSQLEARQRELEAERRELVVLRAELEQTEQRTSQEKLQHERRESALRGERLEWERGQQERDAERDTAAARAERERAAAAEQLVAAQAEAQQLKAQLLTAQRDVEALRAAEALRRSRPVDDDGVPMPVGDMPTAPVTVATAPKLPSRTQELSALQARIAELEAENSRLKDKVTDAERETWKHMKARSEAEAAAAEVREDTVRKLRDARKLASVEMTRAMEEATRKAVQLREELHRTEAERKEALLQLKDLRAERDATGQQAAQLRAELDALRWTTTSSSEGGSAGAVAAPDVTQAAERALAEERSARRAAQQVADEAQTRVLELRSSVAALEQALGEARERAEREQRQVDSLEDELSIGSGARRGAAEVMHMQEELQQRERALTELRAERDALGRLLAEVEREAYARAERARQLRVRLSERERETEALRTELTDRDRRISALEIGAPPSAEIARLSTELLDARQRINDLVEETARREQQGEDVVSTALRERARASRLSETGAHAARERDEAQGRAEELQQRLRDLGVENDRLRGELSRGGTGTESTTEAGADEPARSSAPSGSSDSLPPLAPRAVQRVLQVGQSLGLEPVSMTQGDDNKDQS